MEQRALGEVEQPGGAAEVEPPAGGWAPRTDGRLHVAIIMDGNGRWAVQRGRPRPAGHRAGARAVRRVVEAAPTFGITDLTLYAFSSDNWARPAVEVSALLRLLAEYLRRETPKLAAEGVRLGVIGRRDRLPLPLRHAIGQAEAVTSAGARLRLRVAIDYSARDALVGAANRLAAKGYATRAGLARALAEELDAGEPVPDVDLLIRTAGEQRLSDFLLWECAYAELYFTSRLWPDFGALDLAAALADFLARERRFGRVSPAEAHAESGSNDGLRALAAAADRRGSRVAQPRTREVAV